MGQDHDADGERSETKLARGEDLMSATDRTSTMTDAELCRNNEDVVISLLIVELMEHGHTLGRLTELVRTKLTFVVVMELPGLLDHSEHLLHGFTVGGSNCLPLRDSEPSFGVLGKLTFSDLLIGETDAGKQLAQTVGLLGDSLGLVAREVAIVRLDFLILEPVGDRQLLERGECRSADCFGEFAPVFDDALCARVVETDFNNNLLDGVASDPNDLPDLTGCLPAFVE